MSRSLIFAFLCALILHSVAALMELDAFKSPLSVKVPLKNLTMHIVAPQPIKKPSIDKKPSTVVKKPRIKKRMVKEKVKPKKRIMPKVDMIKKIQPEKSVVKETLPEKDKTLADLSPISFPQEMKNQDDFIEEDTVFILDMVDIPRASPNIKDMPHKVKKQDISGSLSAIPITYAIPIYKSNISPLYPLLARKRGYQGTVLLDVLVSKDGKAASIQVARSSGYKILDKAAIKGVKSWLFCPAKRGDELFEMWVKIPIRFQLK